jgi:hypothetical protein
MRRDERRWQMRDEAKNRHLRGDREEEVDGQEFRKVAAGLCFAVAAGASRWAKIQKPRPLETRGRGTRRITAETAARTNSLTSKMRGHIVSAHWPVLRAIFQVIH